LAYKCHEIDNRGVDIRTLMRLCCENDTNLEWIVAIFSRSVNV